MVIIVHRYSKSTFGANKDAVGCTSLLYAFSQNKRRIVLGIRAFCVPVFLFDFVWFYISHCNFFVVEKRTYYKISLTKVSSHSVAGGVVGIGGFSYGIVGGLSGNFVIRSPKQASYAPLIGSLHAKSLPAHNASNKLRPIITIFLKTLESRDRHFNEMFSVI